jgi:hypothetical protein
MFYVSQLPRPPRTNAPPPTPAVFAILDSHGAYISSIILSNIGNRRNRRDDFKMFVGDAHLVDSGESLETIRMREYY